MSEKRKILQVSYGGLGKGGVQAVIMGIVRELHADFHFDVLVFSRLKGDYEEEFANYGTIYRIPCDRKGNLVADCLEKLGRPIRIFLGSYRILKREHYSAVHCHNEFEGGIVLLAAILAGVPIRVSHAHNSASPRAKPLPVRIYRRGLRWIVLGCSNVRVGCSRQANEHVFGDATKAAVINNAIDLRQFHRGRRRVGGEEIRFINVGRYCFQKNQLFLLEVIKRLASELPNVSLTLVGFGEDEHKIRLKIDELGLHNIVRMLPSTSSIPDLLSDSDYFVFPSTYEGLGIALVEAQAMGLKCFASTAVPEEADLGLCTFIPLSAGPDGWAKIIMDFIQKNHGIEQVVEECRLLAYDVRHIAQSYSRIYQGEGLW